MKDLSINLINEIYSERDIQATPDAKNASGVAVC